MNPLVYTKKSEKININASDYIRGTTTANRILPMEYKSASKVKLALNVILFILPVIFQGCSTGINRVADDTHSSKIPESLPIWSPLTKFERQTIQQIKTRMDNPDFEPDFNEKSWLHLIFILGGEVRTSEQARPLTEIYQEFIRAVEPMVEQAPTAMSKGEILLSEFHRLLLAGEKSSMENYELGQSRPDLLLSTGIFNCASSAILFGIAAEYFGFSAQGVILPQHIFLQLTPPSQFGDDLIEVETTSGKGFNWIHDQTYFEEQDGEWTTNRGLIPNTYEDYLARKIISFESVILNLSTLQHTKYMDQKDVFRLIEIAGYLSDDFSFQENRLIVWGNIFSLLYEDGEFKQILKLFPLIESELERIRRLYPDDSKIRDRLVWLYLKWAIVMLNDSGDPSALDLAEHAYKLLSSNHEDYDSIMENMHYVYSELISRELNQQHFEESISVLERARKVLKQEQLTIIEGYVYNSIGSYYFSQEQWSSAIEYYEVCRDLVHPETGKRTCLSNIEAAYLNWSSEFIQANDPNSVRQILEACMSAVPASQECRKRYLILNIE